MNPLRSRRTQLARVLDLAGLLSLVLRARGRLRVPWLTILTYHSIREAADTPFDRGVIDASAAQFDRQLAVVKRHFTPLGLDDLARFLAGDRAPRNPIMVTFDDGYRDNLSTALPALRRHGIPGVFFVATGFIAEQRLFWWDHISYLIQRTLKARIAFDYPHAAELDTATDEARARASRAACRVVKDTYALDLPRFLAELERATEVTLGRDEERNLCRQLVLDWDGVRELKAAGMEVQSHTRWHRVLQTVPPAELPGELGGARTDLEAQLGSPVHAISYPVGRAVLGSPVLRAAIAQAGYRLGFSNRTGIVARSQELDPLDLRRMAVESDLPEHYFRGILALPQLAH
jgi:peptidoglycan/xylan/chitin deacetylase (PgdA/CDA1 family)